ncbi:ATPase family AAA domain-containing protein 1-like [Canna indica]|uniref:ATPase family AAA domain-containing protein 1-like n=1 Tax=Canna indica TaxID=4628 RepID=A0AAQ3QQ23_9LILI|nr:ATPase family AAA domain-containing protein 1-like [Canna indica]
MRPTESRFLQELVLYAASAALSCLVLFAGLRQLDPNRAASKKALEHKKEIAKRLGRPLVQTNQYEDVIACDVINPDHIDVEFESIGGLEDVKQSLFELVILPLCRPELFSHGKLLSPQKGVLLYGPPGTGKTMLAKALAKESGAVFINVRISNLMSKWFGDAQKLVAAVFSLAYKLQPAIIFIDEVDSFLGQRRNTDHEAMTNMKTEFMSLWDGFTTDQNARVMVLAATNRPSELDEAILRRFTQTFEIGMPNKTERAKILKVILKGENAEENIDYDEIAKFCEGFSGSDILELCKQAAYVPVREFLNDEKNGNASSGSRVPRPLRHSDLMNALKKSRKAKKLTGEIRLDSQSPTWSAQSEPEDEQFHNAIREFSKLMSQIVSNQSEVIVSNQSESDGQDT